jgi:hypothetical protein
VPAIVKKLPHQTLRFAVPLGTSLVMTFLVSGVATYRAIGFGDAAIAKWMTSWMIAWAVAFPTMLIMMPVVRRLLLRVIEPE